MLLRINFNGRHIFWEAFRCRAHKSPAGTNETKIYLLFYARREMKRERERTGEMGAYRGRL